MCTQYESDVLENLRLNNNNITENIHVVDRGNHVNLIKQDSFPQNLHDFILDMKRKLVFRVNSEGHDDYLYTQ